MAKNQYELVYKLGAEVSSQFMSSFNKAGDAVRGMSTALSNLTGKSADVSKLIKLREAAEKSSQAYQKQKEVVENLRKNMDKMQGSDSKMARALEIETQKLDKAKQAMQSQSQAAAELGQKLKLTGVSTSDLTKSQDKMAKAMERVNNIQSKINKVNSLQQRTDSAAMSSAMMVGMMTRRVTSMLSAPVRSAMQMEEVMRNLGDTLNIKSPDGLLQLQKMFEDMSMTIPVAKENLAAMYALAKQNGIGGDLAEFTENAAKFATVLKMEGTEAVSMFTDWNAKLSQTNEETYKLASATVLLSNHNADFAKGIGETVLAVGEYAKKAGLAEEQTAAIAAAMVSTGTSANDAAMGIRQMIKVMSRDNATMSGGAFDAFKLLGYKNMDALQKQLQEDATGVMLDVLEKVRDTIPPEKQLNILEQLFGKQGGTTILPMMRNLDLLRENLAKVSDPVAVTNALMNEFDSQMQNTSNILELANNAWQNFITMIGEPLLGPLKEALGYFMQIAKPIADWIRNNQELVATVTKVALVVGGAVIAFHAARAALLFTISPILSMYKGFLMLQKGLAMINLAMKAMFISPIGLAIAAIAAIIAAGVLLYKNWDKIKEYLAGLWQSFEEKFPGMAKAVKEFYYNSIVPIIDGLKKAFQGVIDFVCGVFTGDWKRAWEGVKNIFTGLWDALSSYIKIPLNFIIKGINAVIGGLNKLKVDIPSWVPGFGGKTFGINIPEIPQLARGGVVTGPTTALVGEGREPEAVLPLSKLESMLNTGLGGISVSYSPVVNMTGSASTDDLRTALNNSKDDFMREFERMIAQQRRISFS